MKYLKLIIPVTDYYFMLAFIWQRKKDWREACGTKKSADACWMGCSPALYKGSYPLLGELHFVRGKIGAGMVAHEITHAALAFANRTDEGDNEEYLCETTQVMTINFWNAVTADKNAQRWIYGKGK